MKALIKRAVALLHPAMDRLFTDWMRRIHASDPSVGDYCARISSPFGFLYWNRRQYCPYAETNVRVCEARCSVGQQAAANRKRANASQAKMAALKGYVLHNSDSFAALVEPLGPPDLSTPMSDR